ncbi:MAG: transketolase [Treponema sp.]|nr:transketolase [Treponema sp.]
MLKTKLNEKANEIKNKVVEMTSKGKGGHVGTSLSEVDILTALFFHTMNFSDCSDPNRDRFVLSKGHGSEGLYCTLAAKGIFPEAELDNYLKHESFLTIHPTRHVPGVEINTGALGHGFPIAVGMALGAKKQNKNWRTFVVTGDGELEEGTNWEAAMAASHYKLGNLTIIVDNNKLQLADFVSKTMEIEPLDEKFKAFGFDVHKVQGNDPEILAACFDKLDYTGNKPHCIIAQTTKGSGVSFMENIAEWHHRVPTAEEAEIAKKELLK